MRKSLILLLAAFAALLLAPVSASAQSTVVSTQFNGLEPLGASAVYEGWLIIDGAPQSTGTFNVDAAGNFVSVQNRAVENAAAATTYVLTIEAAVDPDPAPAATHVLAGDFVDGTAQLSIGHPAALGTDFSTAGGGYIVATPTTATDDDARSGVWFLNPAGGPSASLELPTLPTGWAYEGWVVIDGTPVSTGTFTDPGAQDSSGAFSGPDSAPGFPGEDFIMNAPTGLTFPTDISGRTVVISVEPSPDDGAAPFALKPLVGQVPSDVIPGTLQALGAGPAPIAGTASLTGTTAAPAAEAGQPAELAFTGVESWYLAGGAAVVIAIGAVFVATARKYETPA